jgi:uncharacterized protein YjdB
MRAHMVLVIALVGMSACLEGGGSGSTTGVALCTTVDSVRLQDGNRSLAVGATQQILYTTTAPSTQCIHWTSSNDFIARVSRGGIVQALAVGKVTITAGASGNSDSTQFTIVSTSASRQ